jgi:hypothetical protein
MQLSMKSMPLAILVQFIFKALLSLKSGWQQYKLLSWAIETYVTFINLQHTAF